MNESLRSVLPNRCEEKADPLVYLSVCVSLRICESWVGGRSKLEQIQKDGLEQLLSQISSRAACVKRTFDAKLEKHGVDRRCPIIFWRQLFASNSTTGCLTACEHAARKSLGSVLDRALSLTSAVVISMWTVGMEA